MNRPIRLSALSALLLAFATAAFAGTITFDSSASTVYYVGYTGYTGSGVDVGAPLPAPSLPLMVYTSMPGGLLPTYDLGQGAWAAPIGGSSWVGDAATDGPGGAAGAPPSQGYYTYVSSFAASPSDANVKLSVMADDTAGVFLNGVLVAPFDAIGSDTRCAEGTTGPSCTYPYYTVPVTLGANNVLTIIDYQASGLDSAGIDFELTTFTPEPGSLLLLATGLFILAGFTAKARGNGLLR
jgi:hypothetical protein